MTYQATETKSLLTDAERRELVQRQAAEIERLRTYQDEAAKAWTKLTESQEQEIERLRAALRHAEIALQGVICSSDADTHKQDIRECELALDTVRAAIGAEQIAPK